MQNCAAIYPLPLDATDLSWLIRGGSARRLEVVKVLPTLQGGHGPIGDRSKQRKVKLIDVEVQISNSSASSRTRSSISM